MQKKADLERPFFLFLPQNTHVIFTLVKSFSSTEFLGDFCFESDTYRVKVYTLHCKVHMEENNAYHIGARSKHTSLLFCSWASKLNLVFAISTLATILS